MLRGFHGLLYTADRVGRRGVSSPPRPLVANRIAVGWMWWGGVGIDIRLTRKCQTVVQLGMYGVPLGEAVEVDAC
jgi:hypothetical protein